MKGSNHAAYKTEKHISRFARRKAERRTQKRKAAQAMARRPIPIISEPPPTAEEQAARIEAQEEKKQEQLGKFMKHWGLKVIKAGIFLRDLNADWNRPTNIPHQGGQECARRIRQRDYIYAKAIPIKHSHQGNRNLKRR